MKRLVIVVLAVLLGSAPGISQAISVSQTVDRTEMRFEDTAVYQITISWDGPPTKYRFEKALRLSTDKLKVSSFSSTVHSSGEGADEVSAKIIEYRLAPTGSGVGSVEPLAIEYTEWPDTTVGTLMTDAVTLTIAPPVPVKPEGAGGFPVWIWVVGLVVVLALGAGLVFWQRSRPKPPPPKTPAQAFLDDLADVKKEAGSDLKQFQTGLYKILAVFISVLYRIDINGRSTDAILADLEKADLSREGKDMLSDWLRRAEREKYVPVNAPPGETIRLESEIRSFVQKHF